MISSTIIAIAEFDSLLVVMLELCAELLRVGASNMPPSVSKRKLVRKEIF
jgi:hypothetical protein